MSGAGLASDRFGILRRSISEYAELIIQLKLMHLPVTLMARGSIEFGKEQRSFETFRLSLSSSS